MRMTQSFSTTLRDAPSEAETTSHQLLLRAGFIRQLAAGIFSVLPFAKRTITKIEDIIREEMNAINGQEITMPVVHPAEIWQETKRWYQIGSEMGRFKDKNDRDMVLAMTHEEVVTDLVRKEIRSYRQLPQMIYHLQTKWRDDPRPRAGLIRVREFTMKDSYTLDADWEGLDKQYRAHYQAYFNIFNRCGLPAVAVGSDVGMMGGSMAHEYMYLTPIGEDTLLICENCNYAANRQIAQFGKPMAEAEDQKPMEKVATPNTKTIEALAELLNIPTSRTAKAVFMVASITEGEALKEKFIFAVVRGDMEVNETKLANAVKARDLRPAREEEIRAIGAVPGYGSPVGVHDCLIVVDDVIPSSPNLVAGANEEGFHLLNTNLDRDYKADIVTDIAAAQEGDACPRCDSPLTVSRGVEIGNIFKLGTRYSEAMGAKFLDKDGALKPVIMGSYGIGVGRLLACVAEEHNDADGLIFPISIAPYHVHLLKLGQEGEVAAVAEKLYNDLQEAGIEVLLDDRDETPGVKFKDSDLIGIPIRVTVGDRALKRGGPEVKLRREKSAINVSPVSVVDHVAMLIGQLQAEIAATVVTVPFEDEAES
ncbi:MAG: proline--tRNA ligase [Anaerolineae bacterium]|nr:proline--tRNA ligase [Anaerolineae bacterium]